MEVRNSLDGLRNLLGVSQTSSAQAQSKNNAGLASNAAWEGDRATLSGAANEMALSASGDGVRADKVAAVQAALAAGTYNVSDTAVASKLVDAMLAPRH